MKRLSSQTLFLMLLLVCFITLGQTDYDKAKSAESNWFIVGNSVKGSPLKLAKFGEGFQTILFLGSIHGDEPASADLLNKLCEYLETHPEYYNGKRALILPVANPDGAMAVTRVNANGVDINRNFPTENWTPFIIHRKRKYRQKYQHGPYSASEPETRAIVKIITDEKPKLIVSIHQNLECINYDGPALIWAEKLSLATGLPLKNDIGYNTPGSLGTYSGVERGIPTITMELPLIFPPTDIEDKYLPAIIQLIQSSL